MPENSCYTYFTIVGNFNPDKITQRLGLSPDKSWRIGDLRRNGTKYDFARWSCGTCKEYTELTEEQIMKTISPLLDKIDLLNQIRSEYDVEFYLVVVPTLYAGNQEPCLSPSLEVIDFCHATRTKIDIDLYLMSENDA